MTNLLNKATKIWEQCEFKIRHIKLQKGILKVAGVSEVL